MEVKVQQQNMYELANFIAFVHLAACQVFYNRVDTSVRAGVEHFHFQFTFIINTLDAEWWILATTCMVSAGCPTEGMTMTSDFCDLSELDIQDGHFKFGKRLCAT